MQQGYRRVVFCTREHRARLTRVSHYFDGDPTVASNRVEVEWSLPDGSLRVVTDAGVFGHGRADVGTKLLLLKAPPPPDGGQLLDLGCGTGVVALTMGRRAPGATVWAVDVNSRARELCAENAQRNAIVNVRVAAPEEVPAHVRFDAIWSNPPIRIGKPALHALLVQWLGRLAPTGRAFLVVQKHLGSDSLQHWLNDRGFPTERAATGGGFRVLHVRPQRAPTND
jgi:16S rRNA (guanine1207-N2)-methyltransferase